MFKYKKLSHFLVLILFSCKSLELLTSAHKPTLQAILSYSDTLRSTETFCKSGFSVAINEDGNIIVIGEPYYDDQAGRATIFQLINNKWNPIGNLTGENQGDQSGFSVAINGEGNIVVIGEPYYNNNTGRTRIFQYDGNSWNQIGNLTGENQGDQSGYDVAIDPQGLKLIVLQPSPGNLANSQAKVYTFQSNNWVNSIQDNLTDLGVTNSVAINKDGKIKVTYYGNTILDENQDTSGSLDETISDLDIDESGILTIAGSSDADEVKIFFTASQLLSSSSGSLFGQSVAISKKATHVIIGAPNFINKKDEQVGSIFVHSINIANRKDNPLKEGKQMYGNQENSQFGYSVAVDKSGQTFVVGAPGENNGNGAVYIYLNKTIQRAPVYPNRDKNGISSPGAVHNVSQPNAGAANSIETN